MSEQLSLLARASDPPTSHAAAASMTLPVRAREKARIVEALRTFGGRATREQVALHLGKDRSCISRRITDLVRDGLVEDSGDTAPGLSGRQQIVWRLVP